MRNIPKVFLDTSALLSGLNSPLGASGFILALFKLGKITIVISPEVIKEAENVISKKFPLLRVQFLDFLASHPIITLRLTVKEIRRAYAVCPSEDAPILAGAIKSKADFLITLDKKFQVLIRGRIGPQILLPSEFVREYQRK